ncbi:hypothetical protein [Flagellimonas sp.]|uniref:hypothetical protein n=1 Tax=Flagellimonas sp. TaxID=2058762 RepID=UPI003F4A3684
MKKFVLECIAATILIGLTGMALYKINRPFILKKINRINDKLEIVNLGTSHGDDFEYSDCSLIGQSVNREGNTLYYDLQNYIFLKEGDYLENNAIVVIPVSYHSFGLDENRTDRLPDDSFVNDFYSYLPEKQIFSYSREKDKNLILLRIQENFGKLTLSAMRRLSLMTSSPVKNNIESNASKRANHHKRLGTYSSPDKNLKYLDSLISKILADGNFPVLVTTPYHYAYNENMGVEWLDKNYFDIMKKFSSKFDITYLDYSHDRRFSTKSEYFLDPDHLNEAGKRVFNAVFCDDIQDITK